jgi:hypothetical protein
MTDVAYEITTQNGTLILLDLADDTRDEGSQWMRIPAIDDTGRLNLTLNDGTWRRLLWFYPLDDHRRSEERCDLNTVEIGKRLRIHIGMTDWWDTTIVTNLRALDSSDLPQPPPRSLDDRRDDE